MKEPVFSAEQTIGNTPLVHLLRFGQRHAPGAKLCAKVEMFNPAGSVKDRVARAMIDAAERDGKLVAGGTIIEPTSGNTGIGLAAVGVPRGYRVVLTMPESMSVERRSLLRAYGAELVLTDKALGMKGCMDKANALLAQTPGAVMLGQFDNPANPAAHEATTGPEVYAQTGGEVDIFVAGVGTGGTITGVGRYLKKQKPGVQVVAVEPAASPVLAGGKSGPHGIMGIGAGFVPGALDTGIYDEILPITEEESYEAGRALVETEGLLVGISSGAALAAAVKLAARPENAGKTIVALLPDGGERYLSTPMYAGE